MMCVMVPGVVLAQGSAGGGNGNVGSGGGSAGGGNGNTGVVSNPNTITWKITNPLRKEVGSDIPSIVTAIMKNIVMPLASVLVVLAVLYAGFKFVIAQGNSKELEEARNGFLWVLIGSAVLLGAYGITEVLKETVNQIAPLP